MCFWHLVELLLLVASCDNEFNGLTTLSVYGLMTHLSKVNSTSGQLQAWWSLKVPASMILYDPLLCGKVFPITDFEFATF